MAREDVMVHGSRSVASPAPVASGPAVTHVMWLNERPGIPPFAGAENHLMTLLPSLTEAGVDTELLAIVLNEGEEVRRRLASLERGGVVVTRMYVPMARHPFRKMDPRLGFHFLRLVRELRRRRARIVHLHLDWFFGPVAAALGGADRVVMSVHCDEPQWATRRWRTWLQVVDRVIVRYVCISDRVAEYVRQVLPASAGRLTRIYYGLEPPATAPARDAVRRELGVRDDQFVVGFVGRLAPQKNLELLLGAAERLPEVRFLIVGEGPERDRLLRRAETLTNCRFLGYRQDATRVMEGFDVLCLPSRFEGLGLVMVEAMLRGVPVIGSDAGAIPEILGQGRYGIVFDRFSCEALVEAISRAIANPADLRALAAAAADHARQTYTVAAMAAETAALYGVLAAALPDDGAASVGRRTNP